MAPYGRAISRSSVDLTELPRRSVVVDQRRCRHFYAQKMSAIGVCTRRRIPRSNVLLSSVFARRLVGPSAEKRERDPLVGYLVAATTVGRYCFSRREADTERVFFSALFAKYFHLFYHISRENIYSDRDIRKTSSFHGRRRSTDGLQNLQRSRLKALYFCFRETTQ